MSGGSYDYLYCKDLDDLLQSSYQLREMASDLMLYWPQSKAAHDTKSFVDMFDVFMKVLEDKKKPLEKVWKAQEWWQSNDYVKEQVTQEIWDYEHPASDEICKPTSSFDL